MSYSVAENDVYNREFMDTYVALQDGFFRALADSSSLSFEEIVEGFATYSGAICSDGVISRNCRLEFLDEGEKQFLYDEILTNNLWAVSYHIRDGR